jgi:transposase
MIAPSAYQLFVGIEIAAETFTAFWSPFSPERDRPITLPNTPVGSARLCQQRQATGVTPTATLIVLEATSTYWIALAVALHTAGFHVAVANPAQVRNFAKSLPRRGKTDALDAALLVRFATERQPTPWTPPPELYHELRQRLAARDALVAMRQQARNHRHALLRWPSVVPAVQEHLDQVIADLETRIATLEQELATLLRNGAWSETATLLLSIPGFGVITTAWLLVVTLNLTACASVEAATAYAGLAPQPHVSGSSVRGRSQIGHGGNERLRTALYMATLSAARTNPLIRPFSARLRASGKPMKVARCAAARKLLHLAYAVVKKQQRFNPAYCACTSTMVDEVSGAA